MAAATPALSDSARPFMGMITRLSDRRSACSVTPFPSLPMITAALESETEESGTLSSCSAVAYSGRPFRCSRSAASASGSVTHGRRNTAPIVERTTLGENGSAQPSHNTTAPSANASAVRKIVPRLPGSCKPSSRSTCPAPSSASAVHCGCSQEKMTFCGVSTSLASLNSASGAE